MRPHRPRSPARPNWPLSSNCRMKRPRPCEISRYRVGALEFDRVEAQPVMADGEVKGIEASRKNRASDLIEDFMIAANQVMAQTLTRWGVSSIRRVVNSP